MTTPTEDFQSLVQQLAYLDHTNDTDVAGELTDVVLHVKTEGLSKSEAAELFADRVKLMQLNGVIEKDEVLQLCEACIQKAIGSLFALA